jgi:hypothetical protein
MKSARRSASNFLWGNSVVLCASVVAHRFFTTEAQKSHRADTEFICATLHFRLRIEERQRFFNPQSTIHNPQLIDAAAYLVLVFAHLF